MAIVTEAENGGAIVNRVRQATNTLSMTKYDIFNCLFIGCRTVYARISNQDIKRESEEKDKDKEKVVLWDITQGYNPYQSLDGCVNGKNKRQNTFDFLVEAWKIRLVVHNDCSFW